MDMDDLRLFLAAARLGSISAAARQSSLSQPAASRRIRHLEMELGVDLLDRIGSAIAPNRRGLEFLRFADETLQQYETLQLSFACAQPVRNTISIAASSTPLC